MGHARARKIPAQLVEDEDYQLRHERVRGSTSRRRRRTCARGCRRTATAAPPVAGRGESPRPRPRSWRWPPRCCRPGRARRHGGDVGLLADLVLPARGRRAERPAGEPVPARQLAGRPKTDRLDAQWIARLAEMGLLRPSFVPPPEIRALRDLTRTRLHAGPRPDPGVAAAGEAPGGRSGQAVVGGVARWPGPSPPAASWRPSPAASATPEPWPPWPTTASRAGAPPSSSR